MIPVTYGYARVSKSDRDDRNLDTQFRELANHGIRQELIFSDVMTGRLMSRPGWDELMARVQPNDTVVVVWLDRFSRNFDEDVRIQADLTNRNIGIVAIWEGIDTTDDSAAAKYFRRMMMANGAYQANSTSERIKAGQDAPRPKGGRLGVIQRSCLTRCQWRRDHGPLWQSNRVPPGSGRHSMKPEASRHSRQALRPAVIS